MLQQQANLNFAEKEFRRIQNLVFSGAVNGELLDSATFKLESARAAVQSARAKVETAKANLVAGQAAVKKAEADEGSAESKVKVAEADRDLTLELQKYAIITAPYDGKITKRFFDEGAFIQPALGNSAAKPILQICYTKKMRVVAMLSMSQIAGVTKGDQVILHRITALPGKEFTKSISRISAGVDQDSRSLRIEVDLENPDGLLKPGFYGYLRLLPDK